MSAAIIGIDMAAGPDVTAWRCGCGAVGLDTLVGCGRPDCPLTKALGATVVPAAAGNQREAEDAA